MEMNSVNAEHIEGPVTLSDVLLERLMAWGVDTIFGMPGDGVNWFVEALRKKQQQVRYIHVRHEEIGALAAVAYAKLTGKIGVCFGTTGPGVVHLLNGMPDTQKDAYRSIIQAGWSEMFLSLLPDRVSLPKI